MIKTSIIIFAGILLYSTCNKKDEVDIRKVENILKSSFEDFVMNTYLNRDWDTYETIVIMEHEHITEENITPIKIENRDIQFMSEKEIIDKGVKKYFEIISWTEHDNTIDFELFYPCKGAKFKYSIQFLDGKQRTAVKMDLKQEWATCAD